MKLAVRGCENYCLGRRIKISTISSSPLSRQSADDEDNSLLSWGLPAAIFWLAAFILCCDGHKKPPLSVGGAHKKKKKTRSAVIFHLDLIRWRAIWRRLFLEWKKKNSSRRAEPSGGVRLPNQGLFFSFFFEEKCKKGSSDNNNKMAGFVARPFGYLFERAGPLVTDGRDPKRREHAIVRNVRLLCLKEFG